MPFEDHEGTEVAKGNHVVPKGVAVEELDGGKKKLSEKCPPELKELLEEKDLVSIYDKMVAAVVEEGATRSMFGKWQDAEFDSILDLFRDEFAEKGVKVALCKRSSGSGTYRWLEFIDVDVAENYVPQYDVGNYSGQVIKTMYTTLQFPNGVAVEELKQWGDARQRLKEKIPIYVEKLIDSKYLKPEYDALVAECIEYGIGRNFKNWKVEKLQEVIKNHTPSFEAKGVSIFVCKKEEYISHGQYGGHMEYFRWIEFVDRELQPNYAPQRDADGKKESCVIS